MIVDVHAHFYPPVYVDKLVQLTGADNSTWGKDSNYARAATWGGGGA